MVLSSQVASSKRVLSNPTFGVKVPRDESRNRLEGRPEACRTH